MSAAKGKHKDIASAISDPKTHLSAIKALGRSPGGFLSREWRRALWLRLLNINPDLSEHWRVDTQDYGHFGPDEMKSMSVIDADVARCVAQWDVHLGIRKSYRSRVRGDLRAILTALVLKHGPSGFRYYQGLHEVGLVCLHVGNTTQAYHLLEGISLIYLRGYLYKPFTVSLLPSTEAVLWLLSRVDPNLHAHLVSTECPAFFTVPWLLTWFAHSFSCVSSLERVFDFLLCSSPPSIIFLSVAVLTHKRIELLTITDSAEMHSKCQSLPGCFTKSELETVIGRANNLMEEPFFSDLVRTYPESMQGMVVETSPVKKAARAFTTGAAVAVAAFGMAVLVPFLRAGEAMRP